MKRTLIIVYRPWKGKEQQLLKHLSDHIPQLKKEGLITDKEPWILRTADGAIVEVMEGVSKTAVESAEANPAVQKMWAEISKVYDFEKPVNVPEFSNLFSKFETLK